MKIKTRKYILSFHKQTHYINIITIYTNEQENKRKSMCECKTNGRNKNKRVFFCANAWRTPYRSAFHHWMRVFSFRHDLCSLILLRETVWSHFGRQQDSGGAHSRSPPSSPSCQRSRDWRRSYRIRRHPNHPRNHHLRKLAVRPPKPEIDWSYIGNNNNNNQSALL